MPAQIIKLILIYALCSVCHGQTTLDLRVENARGCRPQEKNAIAEAEGEARRMLVKLIADARQSLNLPQVKAKPLLTDKLKRAIGIMTCTGEQLGKLGYTCRENTKHCDETEAMAYSVFARKIILYRPHHFINETKKRAGTLIHEATHKCGTTDAARFDQTDDVPRDAGLRGFWYSIADTYDWWVANGMCVPGVNCHRPGHYSVNIVQKGKTVRITLPALNYRLAVLLDQEEKDRLETLAAWGVPKDPHLGLICDYELLLRYESSSKVRQYLLELIAKGPKTR